MHCSIKAIRLLLVLQHVSFLKNESNGAEILLNTRVKVNSGSRHHILELKGKDVNQQWPSEGSRFKLNSFFQEASYDSLM